jgi:uncharacterized membrane protein YccC
VIPVVVVAATLGSALSDALRWHPPGPLFSVFALAACASVPTSAATVPIATALATGSAAFSLLVGSAGYVRRSARLRGSTPWPASLGALRHAAIWRDATRFGVVVLIAGVVSTATGLGHPYWAMVAAVAATSGADATARIVRGGHRVLGTLAGLVLAAGILALPLPPLATIGTAVLMQVLAELFVLRNYGLALVFVTPLALLMVALAHAVDPGILLRDRLVETLLGAAVGFAVTLGAHAWARRPAAR